MTLHTILDSIEENELKQKIAEEIRAALKTFVNVHTTPITVSEIQRMLEKQVDAILKDTDQPKPEFDVRIDADDNTKIIISPKNDEAWWFLQRVYE
jgi:Ca2+-binding EF-hand superfamily protein